MGERLSEDEVARLRWAVLRLARFLRTHAVEEGLSPAQSSALATLVREGPQRAGDLAAAEALNPTMVSRLLAHLEEAGLARRGPDPADGRATRVEATPAGRRTVRRQRARHRALLAGRLERLDAGETAALRRALPALEALADGPVPPGVT